MWYSVDRRFDSARTTGFQWLARIIQPNVAALNQEMRYVEVVLIDERDASGEPQIRSAAIDALDAAFAGFVSGMRLSCKDELYRIPFGAQQPGEAFFVMKD